LKEPAVLTTNLSLSTNSDGRKVITLQDVDSSSAVYDESFQNRLQEILRGLRVIEHSQQEECPGNTASTIDSL
jgi:hypothetical protein